MILLLVSPIEVTQDAAFKFARFVCKYLHEPAIKHFIVTKSTNFSEYHFDLDFSLSLYMDVDAKEI